LDIRRAIVLPDVWTTLQTTRTKFEGFEDSIGIALIQPLYEAIKKRFSDKRKVTSMEDEKGYVAGLQLFFFYDLKCFYLFLKFFLFGFWETNGIDAMAVQCTMFDEFCHLCRTGQYRPASALIPVKKNSAFTMQQDGMDTSTTSTTTTKRGRGKKQPLPELQRQGIQQNYPMTGLFNNNSFDGFYQQQQQLPQHLPLLPLPLPPPSNTLYPFYQNPTTMYGQPPQHQPLEGHYQQTVYEHYQQQQQQRGQLTTDSINNIGKNNNNNSLIDISCTSSSSSSSGSPVMNFELGSERIERLKKAYDDLSAFRAQRIKNQQQQQHNEGNATSTSTSTTTTTTTTPSSSSTGQQQQQQQQQQQSLLPPPAPVPSAASSSSSPPVMLPLHELPLPFYIPMTTTGEIDIANLSAIISGYCGKQIKPSLNAFLRCPRSIIELVDRQSSKFSPHEEHRWILKYKLVEKLIVRMMYLGGAPEMLLVDSSAKVLAEKQLKHPRAILLEAATGSGKSTELMRLMLDASIRIWDVWQPLLHMTQRPRLAHPPVVLHFVVLKSNNQVGETKQHYMTIGTSKEDMIPKTAKIHVVDMTKVHHKKDRRTSATFTTEEMLTELTRQFYGNSMHSNFSEPQYRFGILILSHTYCDRDHKGIWGLKSLLTALPSYLFKVFFYLLIVLS